VKIAIVVQRYGLDISPGGAEIHARYIAERLARLATVEVLTTCAKDHVTWKNELKPGEETVRGVVVRRFAVNHPRDPLDFGRRSKTVFEATHSIHDELSWLESEGPTSRALIRHIVKTRDEFDFFVFFSARYDPAFHGARAVPHKAVLVPTAERDPAVGVSILGPVFRGARAVMYNSPEERALINGVSGNQQVPGVVVGVGSVIPERSQPWRLKRKFNLRQPYALYVGRIDENKGCAELFSHFDRYAAEHPNGLDLLLIGEAVMPVPKHRRIRHLGVLSDEDKFDALAGCDALVMPSPYESLSMVAIEAWAMAKPVLANGRCDVLRGQCVRSNGGLFYESFAEFSEALFTLEASGPAHHVLGQNGRDFFRRHYTWPVIEKKYMEMFDRLKREPSQAVMEPLPGWFARRRRDVKPAREVVHGAPAGPVR
jgi:glycosyltransferase involved in cell wall biosynthesis